MNILTIQSQVVYGHVGNSAATFVLQRLGHDVWQVPTVLYSNHLGKPSFKGRLISADQVSELIHGLEDLGALDKTDAILTGYLGSADIARFSATLIDRMKARSENLLFVCDPVMGDDDTLYVKPDLADAIAETLVPRADVLLPNIFELRRLSGRDVRSRDDALAALQNLRDKTGAIVIGTGLPDETDANRLRCLGLNQKGVTERLVIRRKIAVSGTGDCFAALYLGNYLISRNFSQAFHAAIDSMDTIVEATEKAGSDELQIVSSQSSWAAMTKISVP